MKTKSKLNIPSLYALDFDKDDWDSLGEPVPDSQILWGNHNVAELVDILAPGKLEDIILNDRILDLEGLPDY